MSQWMQSGGPVPSSSKYVNALVSVYGPEVYDLLKISPEDIDEIQVKMVPPALRRRLADAALELERELRTRSLSPTDPAALQLTLEIFRRHGIAFPRPKK